MDATAAILIAYTATLIVVGVVALSRHHGERQKMEIRRRNTADACQEELVSELMAANGEQVDRLLALVERLVSTPETISHTPQQPLPPNELYGQVEDQLSQFHDTVSRDPIDTPDWTDDWLPDERGDQPRVATVRPGDSIVPGEGNWHEMMSEGRAMANGGVATGEDQWSE